MHAVIPPTYSEDAKADDLLTADIFELIPRLRGALRPVRFGRKAPAVAASIRAKLALLGITQYADVVGRNLSALAALS